MHAHRLAIRIQVRQQVDLRMVRFMVLVQHMDLDVAEAAREGHLRFGDMSTSRNTIA